MGRLAVVALLALGFGLRLWLAWRFDRCFDLESYSIVARIVRDGGNVYALTDRYNYSPVWFWCLGGLDGLSRALGLPFHFVVRSALTLVDGATAAVLVAIARLSSLSPWRTALLFVLNPVSIIITGFHGQFDNLAILFLLLALRVQLRSPSRGAAWALSAMAVLVKHITFFMPLYVLSKAFPKPWVRFLAWGFIGVAFGLSFLPYVSTGLDGIRQHVFGYSGNAGYYGASVLAARVGGLPVLKAAMAIALVGGGLLASRLPLLQAALLPSLIFLVLTPGFGNQYLVLPIALGALRPSWAYYAFSASATVFLLGNHDELFLPGFRGVLDARALQVTWGVAIAWLVCELWSARRLHTRQVHQIEEDREDHGDRPD